MGESFDAIVVGSGPNGLAAAITLARAGIHTLVLEAKETPGGGCRTAELTLPGFHHDICAAIHPMGVASPFFQNLPAAELGLEWLHADIPLAHPLPDGSVATLHRSLQATGESLANDALEWSRLFDPFLQNSTRLFPEILRPLRGTSHPFLMAKFGLLGLRSCEYIVKSRFNSEPARALFAGCAAHSFLPLNTPGSASFGLVLALTAHAVGWPCARGGSNRIIDAMVNYLRKLGGEVRVNSPVSSMSDIPNSRVVLFDLSPRQIAAIAGPELPATYTRQLLRYTQGPAVFKIDWALRQPIPWRNPECARAGTVHVGGTFQQIAASEAAAWTNQPAEHPFVLVAQQSAMDPTRAPAGQHTGWAYCHVPHACPIDMTDRIEAQIERYAPGFRDTILARHTMSPADYERHNPTMLGGDITGGANTLRQSFFRPVPRWNPYTTPNPRLFLCSSSTPPGGGVHGMCGYWSAQSALRRLTAKQHR
jgi:phytoene dehydrogenase-like protein